MQLTKSSVTGIAIPKKRALCLRASVVSSTTYFRSVCAHTCFSPGLSDSIAGSAASIEFILVELHVVEDLVLHADADISG
jgi:hypothetical protein